MKTMKTIECKKCFRIHKIKNPEKPMLLVCTCGRQLINRMNQIL